MNVYNENVQQPDYQINNSMRRFRRAKYQLNRSSALERPNINESSIMQEKYILNSLAKNDIYSFDKEKNENSTKITNLPQIQES